MFKLGDRVLLEKEAANIDVFTEFGIHKNVRYTINGFTSDEGRSFLKFKDMDDDISFSESMFYKCRPDNTKLYKRILDV